MIERSHPILVNSSELYCKKGSEVCKHLHKTSKWCKLASKSIPKQKMEWMIPDWCPTKMDAYFPKDDRISESDDES